MNRISFLVLLSSLNLSYLVGPWFCTALLSPLLLNLGAVLEPWHLYFLVA